MSINDTFINTVKGYLNGGLSVIALTPNAKTPAFRFRDSGGVKIDDVEKLWGNTLYNVGLLLKNILVIDLDLHSGNGIENFYKSEFYSLIPPTLWAITPSGGKHIFLEIPPQFVGKLTQNISLLSNVDIKTGANSYVLIQPSYIKGKGFYRFDPTHSSEIATAPTELLERLLEKQRQSKPKTSGFSFGGNFVREKSRVVELFEILADGFGVEGGRNDKLASFVGSLLSKGVESQTAEKLARIANQQSFNPLPLSEVERTVKSIVDMNEREKERGSKYGR